MSDAGDPPKGDDKRLNNWVAVTVVLLTVFMAITKTKDDNINQAMQKAKQTVAEETAKMAQGMGMPAGFQLPT